MSLKCKFYLKTQNLECQGFLHGLYIITPLYTLRLMSLKCKFYI